MKIEDAINQKKPFASALEKAIVNILFTSSHCKDLNEVYFKKFGITDKQYNILRIVKGAEYPISTNQIRSRMLEKMSDTSRLVDRLAKKNLIFKSKNELDHRLVDIQLTEKGESLLTQVLSPAQATGVYKKTLSDHELELLSDLLDRFRG